MILTYLILCALVVVQAYYLSVLRDEVRCLQRRVRWLEDIESGFLRRVHPVFGVVGTTGPMGITGAPLVDSGIPVTGNPKEGSNDDLAVWGADAIPPTAGVGGGAAHDSGRLETPERLETAPIAPDLPKAHRTIT